MTAKSIPFLFFLIISAFLMEVPITGSGSRQGENRRPALIPMPQQLEWTGRDFKADGKSGRFVQRIVENLPGIEATQKEAYSLQVNPDSVILLARTQTGLFRGLQTIRQLTFFKSGKKFIAGCKISDWPAFAVRGFMQDVGRNYMSMEMLKEQIDVLAAYKFNVFHLHLTDNPGWRLESLKYPQLKEAASMSRWPGKYYSREEFLELVNYCNDRHITLIPELDVPGHCEAFRKALQIGSMSDPRVKTVLSDIIDELCNLVPVEKMPIIHLGTDEVWNDAERPSPDLLPSLIERIRRNGREVMVWKPGQTIKNDSVSITQLWSSKGHPEPGHRYIDSRLNYLNHLDPLAGIPQLYFDRICGVSSGDSIRMGGILCCWNDNNVNDGYDILRQNPVFPGILTYSETSWKGQTENIGVAYLAKLPDPENHLFKEFTEFEDRLIRHRDLFFSGKPFPYVRQTGMVWNLIGPFDNGRDVNRKFPVEDTIQKNYLIDRKVFTWNGPFHGGTIHIRHFFGYPSCFEQKEGTVYAFAEIWSPVKQETGWWIGFQDWSRSGGRRGGPFPQQGQWHKTNPEVWVNGREVPPPVWNNPGLAEKTEDIPFSDENYYFREPARITLNKGWNRVLIKIPQDGTSWKWMFTFVPVEKDKAGMHEINGLKFRKFQLIQ